MLRDYFLINLVLLIIIGFLCLKFYETLSLTMELPAAPAAKEEKKEEGVTAGGKEKVLNESLFQAISNMDLFRPTRSPAPLMTSPQQMAPKIPPKLFGTIILNEDKSAILEDPNTKSTRTYHINDSIAGYTVTDILEEKVVLLSDGEKVEVRLREDKKGMAPVRPQMPVRPQPQMQPPVQPQVQPQAQPQVQIPPQTPPQRGIQQRPIRPTPALRNRPVPPPPPPQQQQPPQQPPQVPSMDKLPDEEINLDIIDMEQNEQ